MSSSTSLDQIKQAMAATNAIFDSEVFQKRNFDALDRIYTTDATILPPGAHLISGRAAIKEFWAGAVNSLNATSAVLSSVQVFEAGEDIVEIGGAVLTIDPQGTGAPSKLEVKYVVYWKQQGGDWKWHVDIWNTNA